MLRAILVGGAIEGEPGARNPAYFAPWNIIPMVWRIPERTRLTPCRRLTRYAPFVPFTGLLCTANATASPCRNGTTSTRLCTRGRCSVRTNSPTGEILSRLGEKNRYLERKGKIAVEVLVQVVEVARDILQQQRWGRVWPPSWHSFRKSACCAPDSADRYSCGRSTRWQSRQGAGIALCAGCSAVPAADI